MSQQTGAQVRIVDPVLTTKARGYVQPMLVGEKLFPRVPTGGVYAGNVIEFGKEHFYLTPSRRAPGADIKRVQAGYLGKPFSVQPRALAAVVPVEHQREALAALKIDKMAASVSVVRGKQGTELESEQATIARTPGNFGGNVQVCAGATRWTQTTGTPIQDVRAGREIVRRQIGMYPNVAIASPSAMNAAREHPTVREYFKYTGSKVVTADMLKDVFELDALYVGAAMTGNSGTGVLSDIWGDDFIMAYVPQNLSADYADRDAAMPSFGYTYTVDGMPIVEASYYDQGSLCWVSNVIDDCQAQLTGQLAGYLIQNAGT